jgi:hypothetical protein
MLRSTYYCDLRGQIALNKVKCQSSRDGDLKQEVQSEQADIRRALSADHNNVGVVLAIHCSRKTEHASH